MLHPLSGNPLFTRTLAEELRLFGVHEELTEWLTHYLKCLTIDDLFDKVIERVEGECGKKAVEDTLTAIWALRSGLTEKEILGIADLKPAGWAPIRNALDEALLEADVNKLDTYFSYKNICTKSGVQMGVQNFSES
jgi:hypothetical protein